MVGRPHVSIITPSLDRHDTIAVALDSVRAQEGPFEIEHVVVDGGSSDGTLDLVRRRSDVTLLSGRDVNLYDAINKGIQVSRGAVIGLLNADDTYCPGALAHALDALSQAPDADMACGIATVRDSQERVVERLDRLVNRSIAFHDLLLDVPAINARFFRRSLMDRLGGFDIRYPVAADRDFLLRAARDGAIAVPIEYEVYRYRQHPGSLTIGGRGAGRRISEDHMALAEQWLTARGELSPVQRDALLQVHAHGALLGVGIALRGGDWPSLRHCLRRGAKLGPAWGWAAIRLVRKKMVNRLTRRALIR